MFQAAPRLVTHSQTCSACGLLTSPTPLMRSCSGVWTGFFSHCLRHTVTSHWRLASAGLSPKEPGHASPAPSRLHPPVCSPPTLRGLPVNRPSSRGGLQWAGGLQVPPVLTRVPESCSGPQGGSGPGCWLLASARPHVTSRSVVPLGSEQDSQTFQEAKGERSQAP